MSERSADDSAIQTESNGHDDHFPVYGSAGASTAAIDVKTGIGIPMRNHDGSIMLDHRGKIVYRSQFLSTHPLRSECRERVVYAGKKLPYVSGEGVIRSMNAVFGHGGWGTELKMERKVMCEKDDLGRWVVGYLATVRVTLSDGRGGVGVSHEDCGSGEGINENLTKAHEKALKSAVTDAMKRAARHFGERLGNALYVKGNSIKTAPKDNKTALMDLERREALNLYGDQNKLRDSCKNQSHRDVNSLRTSEHRNDQMDTSSNNNVSRESSEDEKSLSGSSTTSVNNVTSRLSNDQSIPLRCPQNSSHTEDGAAKIHNDSNAQMQKQTANTGLTNAIVSTINTSISNNYAAMNLNKYRENNIISPYPTRQEMDTNRNAVLSVRNSNEQQHYSTPLPPTPRLQPQQNVFLTPTSVPQPSPSPPHSANRQHDASALSVNNICKSSSKVHHKKSNPYKTSSSTVRNNTNQQQEAPTPNVCQGGENCQRQGAQISCDEEGGEYSYHQHQKYQEQQHRQGSINNISNNESAHSLVTTNASNCRLYLPPSNEPSYVANTIVPLQNDPNCVKNTYQHNTHCIHNINSTATNNIDIRNNKNTGTKRRQMDEDQSYNNDNNQFSHKRQVNSRNPYNK